MHCKTRLAISFLILFLVSSTPAFADQIGGMEIYRNYWRFGERITITACGGLVKYKYWEEPKSSVNPESRVKTKGKWITKMSEPPNFQVRVNGRWKTVAKSTLVPNSDGCAKQSDFPPGATVDRILLISFSWTVSEIGDGDPDLRFTSCKGSARQLQVQMKFPHSPYPPRPIAVVVCS